MNIANKSNNDLWCHADVHITDRTIKNYLEVTHINGNLTIECSEYAILPKLQYTKGLNIVIGTNVSLPTCDTVKGDIFVQQNARLTIGGKGEGIQIISLNDNAFLKIDKCKAIDTLRVLNGSTATLPSLERIYDVLRVLNATLRLDACQHIAGRVEAEGKSCIELPVCLEVTRDTVAYDSSVIELPQCLKVGGKAYADEEAKINLSPAVSASINKAAFTAGKISFEVPIDYKALSALSKADSLAIF